MQISEIKNRLAELRPDIPWAHYFDLGGVETINQSANAQFFNKAVGLQKIANVAKKVMQTRLTSKPLSEARVLDIASAEGVHSIELSRCGVKSVLGIEGRQLYVDRSTFVADCLGVKNVRFQQGDVRKINPAQTGAFDFVLCSGILHHLGKEDFASFVSLLGQLTADTCMLYTHVSNPKSIARFKLIPTKPLAEGFSGSLFREHQETANERQKRDKVRASLDNNFSFWAEEPSLVDALIAAGFQSVEKLLHPHVFNSWDDKNVRVIMICRK